MSVMASMTSPEHDITENSKIKVWFRFVPREDWLPYSTEGLWACQSPENVETVLCHNGPQRGR
jgi:hypothetical protein